MIGKLTGRVELHRGKKVSHHGLHLPLVGMSDADDGFLDVVGGIFGNCQTRFCRGEENDRPGMAELKRSNRVLRDKSLLDRNRSRHVLDQDSTDTRMQRRQALP